MKIKLTQPGFETYNGQMGVTFFEEGLSVSDVLVQDAIRMSAVMLCEWEDGTSPNIAQSLIDNSDTPAPTFVSGEDGQHELNDDEIKAAQEVQAALIQAGAPVGPSYTFEQLAEIADAKGIQGLREISDPLGIKSNSIKNLIDAIVKVTAPAPAVEVLTEVAEAPAEAVVEVVAEAPAAEAEAEAPVTAQE